MQIEPHEVEIRGSWHSISGSVVADSVSRRIDALIRNHLKYLGRDVSGWDVLYIDPDDGRLWELTCPEPEMHGGGPPLLRHVTDEQAHQKYRYTPA